MQGKQFNLWLTKDEANAFSEKQLGLGNIP